MIAIRNGEPSVDNTDISLGGAYGEPQVWSAKAPSHGLDFGNGNAFASSGNPTLHATVHQYDATVDNTMAELLPRGFVSVFRTGRGRLPVAVLGGFRPRRSQEQFASQSTPN